MKLSVYKSGKSGRVKSIILAQEHQQRLLPIGIYKGAYIHMERQGNTHYPALLFVRGNFIMMRMEDIAAIEMEE